MNDRVQTPFYHSIIHSFKIDIELTTVIEIPKYAKIRYPVLFHFGFC